MKEPNLHSRYNPEAEAERYIDSLNLNKDTDCFILIEPGEGYMIPVLKKKYPKSRIIPLYVKDSNPENKLKKELAGSISFKIIEWRPSLHYYKDDYVKLLSLTVKFLKRLDAEKRTVRAFGHRWVKNFFKNLGNLNSALLYKETEIPVIITGSGPSLEDALPIIKESQDNFLIIAASSSFLALKTFGINPDLIIATDGGSWALKHLYHLYREQHQSYKKSNPLPILAVNLCSALPSQCYNASQLILNDGSLWQNVILRELQLPSVLIPQRGTVTASAVDLALQLTCGNIYLAGIDLSINDIRSHVKPYAFDSFLYEKANRILPVYSQVFLRSNLLKEGGSLKIYKDWFEEQFEKWPKRIHELHELPRIKDKREENLFKAVPVKINKKGEEILLGALQGEYAEQLRDELVSLLGEEPEAIISSLHSLRFGVSARGCLQ